MNREIRKIIVLLLSFGVGSVSVSDAGSAAILQAGLKVRVLPTEGRYSRADRVEVLVLLENVDVDSWTLIPRIVVAAEDSGLYPEPYLAVRVTDPTGRELSPRLSTELSKRVPPSACDFAHLGPSAIIGRRLSLTQPPFGFVFGEHGRYLIRATLTSRAGDWLKHADQHDLCWRDSTGVFDGTLESEELAVEIE